MERLPDLVTAAGVFALPLSGRAAAGVAAALAAGSDFVCDQRLLIDALAVDAPLALWATCLTALGGHSSPHTLGELAEWLASAILVELDRPATATIIADSESAASDLAGDAACAELAARSLGVARLAGRLAQHQHCDAERGYFLGLLHAARQWLAVSARSGPPAKAFGVLPDWLDEALAKIQTAGAGPVASAADCVALAVRMIDSAGAEGRPEGFAFDAAEHAAKVTLARQTWLLPPAQPGMLTHLAAKLARLRKLSGEFERALEREKLESLKELAQGAGHEINNPLANISARAQTLLRSERDPDRRRMLASINAQAFRAHEMIADMMLFARPPQPKFEDFDLAALLRELAAELQPQAELQHTELALEIPKCPVMLSADKLQIAVAARAVCANALEALVAGGAVVIALAESAPLDGTVQFTVSDNGPGISTEVRRHLFDPFYSGREAGRGLGFGLAKCWRIVTMHGGRIEVDSPAGVGSRFTIVLRKRSTR